MTRLAIRTLRVVRRRLRRHLRRRRHAHGLILTYHRVASDHGPDPWRLRVTPDHFRDHLEYLVRVSEIVPLGDLLTNSRAGRRTRPVVSLTFDDGYADNLYQALPLLEHYGVPATIFIATAWIGRNEPFWWDALAWTILGTKPLPRELDIHAGDQSVQWQASGKMGRSGVSAADRAVLLAMIRKHMIRIDDDSRNKLARDVEEWIGRPLEAGDDARPMTADELRRLNGSQLIEIGTHTRSHCSLPARPVPDRVAEIVGSRDQCEQLVGSAPKSFSYPFGDHDAMTARIVSEAGFHLACTNEQDLAWADGDPFLVPRFVALDWDGQQFERRLRREWLP